MPKALKPSPIALLGVVAKQGEAPLTPPYALGENTKRGDWDDLGEHHARQKLFSCFPFVVAIFVAEKITQPAKEDNMGSWDAYRKTDIL